MSLFFNPHAPLVFQSSYFLLEVDIKIINAKKRVDVAMVILFQSALKPFKVSQKKRILLLLQGLRPY